MSSYKCIGNEGRKSNTASISQTVLENEKSKTIITGTFQAVSDETYSLPNRWYNSYVLSCKNGRGKCTKNEYLIKLAIGIW